MSNQRKLNLGKVVLRSTTKISLHDRFKAIEDNRPLQQDMVQNQRVVNRVQRQQTAANQRTARHFQGRPAMLAAAFGIPQGQSRRGAITRFSNQTAYGGQQAFGQVSVKSRLGLARGQQTTMVLAPLTNGMRSRQPLRARLGISQAQRVRGAVMSVRGRGVTRRRARGGNVQMNGTLTYQIRPRTPAYAGGRGRGRRGRFAAAQRQPSTPRGGRGGRRLAGVARGYATRGRGGRFALRRPARTPAPSKDALDKDLDEYMSKSRSHMEANLGNLLFA